MGYILMYLIENVNIYPLYPVFPLAVCFEVNAIIFEVI